VHLSHLWGDGSSCRQRYPNTFLASVGAELVASILEKASRGEVISDEELQQVLNSPQQLFAVQKLIKDRVLGPEASLQILAQAAELRESAGNILSSISSARSASHQEHGFIYDEVRAVKAEQHQGIQEIKGALDRIFLGETVLLAKLDAVLTHDNQPMPTMMPLVRDTMAVNTLKSIGVQADQGMRLVSAGLMTRDELISSLDTYVDVYFYDPRIQA